MKLKSIHLARYVTGTPRPDDFEVSVSDLADLGPVAEGQVLLEVEHLSLDPYMRARMSGRASYVPPTPLGSVMPGEAVARVLESRHPAWNPGDRVLSHTGWRTHALMDGERLRAVPTTGLSPTLYLGALGMPGLTAYTGLQEIGRIQPGETLVVAAATGPVGSMVGQLAHQAGARTVAVAGGETKCAIAVEKLGFDAAVDHRSSTFADDLEQACSAGIDVYFELVGGQVFRDVLPLLNPLARIPVCGLVGQWDQQGGNEQSASQLLRTILDRQLTLRGFIVSEFADRHRASFESEVGSGLQSGTIIALEQRVSGLMNAPEALVDLIGGRFLGKVVVDL